jgi:hypothetical protein
MSGAIPPLSQYVFMVVVVVVVFSFREEFMIYCLFSDPVLTAWVI